MRLDSVLAKNRPSPYNEEDYIEAYKKAVPSATNDDNYDIAAVITYGNVVGHALMDYSSNRSPDNRFHLCYHFVSDDELRYFM